MASWPLRVEELAESLAFDFKAGPISKFHKDRRLEDPYEAVLALVNARGPPVIHFSHFSVRVFSTSTRLAERRDAISLLRAVTIFL